MKKPAVVSLAAILLALAALGLPPVLGMMSESQVGARVETLDRSGVLSAEVTSFERGWFSSTARIELGLAPAYADQIAAIGPNAGDPLVDELLGRRGTIVVELAHGPITTRDGLYFGLSKIVARLDPETDGLNELLQELGIPYLFEFRGRTAFSGALEFDADIPPIEIDEGPQQLQFSGALIDGSLAGRNLVSRVRADSLTLAADGGRLALEGLRAAGDHEFRSSYVVLGTADFSIDRLQAWNLPLTNQPALEAANMRAAMATRIDDSGEFVDGEITYAVDSMTVTDTDGRLSDASLGVAVRSIDVAAMEAYFEAVQRAALGPADPARLRAELEPVIQRLLAGSPSFSLDPIRFSWNGEPFAASMRIDTSTAALPPSAATDLRDPVLWRELLSASASASVSKVLAQEIAVEVIKTQLATSGLVPEQMPPDQVDYMAGAQAGLVFVSLVGQGMLTDEGQTYSAELRFADGSLTVNGNPLPFGLP